MAKPGVGLCYIFGLFNRRLDLFLIEIFSALTAFQGFKLDGFGALGASFSFIHSEGNARVFASHRGLALVGRWENLDKEQTEGATREGQ
jgi:hypothetical protein